jgi:L-histidine N-alpha-methyltransferase
MEKSVAVMAHPSCFPGRYRAALVESFRARQMNHRFHYESEKQAQRWLALHEAYSPARTDEDCFAMYERAFAEAGKIIDDQEVAVVSLGCGGGQKDLTLLNALERRELSYVPADVSMPLALGAHLLARKSVKVESRPLLVDLPHATDLEMVIGELVPASARRVIAFFGLLPNFEPAECLRPLSNALRKDDFVLLSANLAPGTDYNAGVRRVLPLYDNQPTRQWLITVLSDVGLDVSPSDVEFSIERVDGLLRIEANYRFKKPQSLRMDREQFELKAGEKFRLFFSYRHTPEILSKLLGKFGIRIERQWIAGSEEEGVFLCRKV